MQTQKLMNEGRMDASPTEYGIVDHPALLAQKAVRLPHKRGRTVILPALSQPHARQGYHYGTVLVPEPYGASHLLICAKCQTVLHERTMPVAGIAIARC